MTKLSKGPWEAPGMDGDAYVVCTAKSHGKRRTVAHAYTRDDAALIAAAPAMLASLREIVEAGSPSPYASPAFEARIDRARAAIAMVGG